MDEAGSLRCAYRGQLQRIASLKRQLQDLDLGNGDDDEELRELEVSGKKVGPRFGEFCY